LSIAAGLTACAAVPPREAATMPSASHALVTLSGTVLYRERIALPREARLAVRISDVSRMDAPALVVAEIDVATKGRQVPIPFEIAYDPARIDARGRYAVSARIVDG